MCYTGGEAGQARTAGQEQPKWCEYIRPKRYKALGNHLCRKSILGDVFMSERNVFRHPRFEQMLVYEEMKGELEKKYSKKWVAICNSEILGAYESFDEAQQATTDAGLDYLNCCIRQVGVEPMPIILLGT